MIMPDTNLLVYAYNDGALQHREAVLWLEEQLSGREPVAFTWSTLSGFIRISTNRRIPRQPASAQQAVDVVDGWLRRPVARIIRPGDRHWAILRSLLLAVNVGGNLVTDAHLAALAIEHDCELCSADTDFARFPGLRWSNPLRR